MDTSNKDNLGDIKVSKDDIIENVAEKILTQEKIVGVVDSNNCLLYTSPSPRDLSTSRMPSSA